MVEAIVDMLQGLGQRREAVRCHVDEETAELGRHIVETAAPDLLYARVYPVPDEAGQLRLMELELIEPELFLRFEPASVTALAAAIAALVER